MAKRNAVIVGVGADNGLGAALCRRFAREGYRVFVAGRTFAKIDAVARSITASGGSAEAVATDATQEDDVLRLFDLACADDDQGHLNLVVFNAGNNRQLSFVDLPAATFEEFWRVGCYAGFLVGREAVRRLGPAGRGTIIFTGASASLRGKPGYAHFSAAKAGLRVLSQSMAREFGPKGIHVAHVVVDGGIDGERFRTARPEAAAQRGIDGLLNIDAIAEAYWQLHVQHPSAWTLELDLRPYREPF